MDDSVMATLLGQGLNLSTAVPIPLKSSSSSTSSESSEKLSKSSENRTKSADKDNKKSLHLMDFTEEEKRHRLDIQSKENFYHNFVENNLILKQGLIDKRKVRGAV